MYMHIITNADVKRGHKPEYVKAVWRCRDETIFDPRKAGQTKVFGQLNRFGCFYIQYIYILHTHLQHYRNCLENIVVAGETFLFSSK